MKNIIKDFVVRGFAVCINVLDVVDEMFIHVKLLLEFDVLLALSCVESNIEK